MRNRFCASFRMAENAKRTPELTRKVKNRNVHRNKIKSAIFWQKSYRLEWNLIICHYLNLYVHCISFITRLFLLWKLTGPNPISRLCVYRNGTQGSFSKICVCSQNTVNGFIFMGNSFSWFFLCGSTNPWIPLPTNDFLFELWRKILWPHILNPRNVSFYLNPR